MVDKNNKNELNEILQGLKEDKPLINVLKNKISDRNIILSFFFLIFAVAIFVNTAILQFSSNAIASGVEITGGSPREHTVKAPRGNIFDRYGVPLAVTEDINVIYLCDTGLEGDILDSMLLDLALYLEEEGVDYIDPLSEYISADATSFKKDIEDILYWQSRNDTFALKNDTNKGNLDHDDAEYVKTDPKVFFDYLRYTLFDLQGTYSVEDSYRIMRFKYAIRQNNWSFRNGKPLQIARRVNDEVIYVLEEQSHRFSGILSAKESERVYLPDSRYAGHIIGYMGSISSDEYNELRTSGYSINDKVGKAGVEKYAERYLHGSDGTVPYNLVSYDGKDETFLSLTEGKAPIPGGNIMLTIDMELQKKAYDSLEENIEFIKNNPRDKNKGDADSGAVVMLEIETGEVLAMVSYPTFDPIDFQMAEYDTKSMERMIEALTNTKDKPMLNRAMMEIYAPGSTFKPVTAVAALEEGISTIQHCGGTEMIGEWRFRCLEYPTRGHGTLNLTRGLATSCNIYFHKLGVATGIDNLDKWMKILGLGEYTGIDLPGEEKGYRSNKETKKLMRINVYDQIWFPADTAQTAIGQFENKYTVLQLARYTAALASGNLVTPHVIKEITRNDGTILLEGNDTVIDLPVNDSTLDAVKKGMIAVSQDREGTARSVFGNFPITIACKTGTAETGHEDRSSSNALFICYAPADDPKVAIAQIVEKGVWGSNTMSIARDLLTEYFDLLPNTEIEIISEISLD